MRNIDYVIKGTTITGTVVSKGETFTATANLYPGDVYSENLGKLIVKYRLEIQQRKRDLANTNDVIERLKVIYDNEYENKPESRISKHWMRFLQKTCEERKSQLENISFAKNMLKILTSGDRYEDMVRNIIKSRYSDERTEKLLIVLINTLLNERF